MLKVLGIVPANELVSRYTDVRSVNDPILLGIVPANDSLPNVIDVTLAYVADVLFELHVTP